MKKILIVTCLFDPEPVVSARLAKDLAEKLVKHGIMAGGGDFYAQRPLEAMGVDLSKGVLRLSFTHYTSQSEVDQLLNALDDIL